MAGSFVVVSQAREIQVLSPTVTIPVQKVGISTIPHGVTVEFPIPVELWPDAGGRDLLESLASEIETLISDGRMVGGQYVQDYDDNGLLVDYLDATVRWEDPNHIRPPQETTVLIPLGLLLGSTDPWFQRLPGSAEALLSAARTNLAQTAGL